MPDAPFSSFQQTPKPPGLDWRQMHLWQIQPVRDALLLLTAVGILYLGYMLSVVTVPMLIALALAYLVEPVCKWLVDRTPLTRPVVAGGMIVLVALVIIGPVVLGGSVAAVQGIKFAQRVAGDVTLLQRSIDEPQNEAARAQLMRRGKAWTDVRDYVVEQERRMKLRKSTESGIVPHDAPATNEQKATDPATSATSTPATQPPTTQSAVTPAVVGPDDKPGETSDAQEHTDADATPRVPDMADLLLPPEDAYLAAQWLIKWVQSNAQSIGERAIAAGGGAVGAAVQTFGFVGKLLFGAFLTAFFFFFFCVGYDHVLTFIRGLLPEKSKSRALTLITQMDAVIAGFVRGRLTICALLVMYYTLGYWIIGVPAWALLGVVIGMLTLVPYAAGVGIPVTILLLWFAGHSGIRGEWWWAVAAPLVVHGGQQLLDDYFLTPKIQGKSTNMDTPTILFASIAGGSLGGFYGLLLAIPVAACIKILLKEVFWPRFRAWSAGRATDPLPISKE